MGSLELLQNEAIPSDSARAKNTYVTSQIASSHTLPRRILVVDDDSFAGAVISGALTAAGAGEVKVCTSGVVAVAAAPGFQPELIILDFMMSGMDGGATWQALYTCLKPLPPVIFLTARDDADFYDAVARFGAAGVLAKPFDPAALADQVRRILEQFGVARWMPRPPAAKKRRLAAVAEAFQRSLPATSARIAEALYIVQERGWTKEGTQSILADAHSLAGSAGLFGFTALGAAAHEAERLLLNAMKLERSLAAAEVSALSKAVTTLIAACRAANAP
jgi:two-component system OmpR family response regulator